MEIVHIHGCYGDYITIDGKDLKKKDKKLLKEACIKAISNITNDYTLFETLLNIVDAEGTITNEMECDQCGEWNFDKTLIV